MTEGAPTLSVGLAVRNGVDVVGRCIESIISQDFRDLELVISDNVSDDGTDALVKDMRVLIGVFDLVSTRSTSARTKT